MYSKTKEGHWLGKGIYFYENIYYAIEWGIIRFLLGNNSYDNYKKQCSVIKGMLNCEEYEILDLNDPLGYSIYQEILKNIKKRFPNEVEKISKGKDIEIIRLLEELENKKTSIVILDAPTLIENDLHKEMDYVILVWVDNNTQIQRVRSRDSLMREDAINRINSQMPLDIKKDFANIVIENNDTLAKTKEQVDLLIEFLRSI